MDNSFNSMPLILMLVGFFFLMIYPQMRRQKKGKEIFIWIKSWY
jgi:preprotein translocase subunit YajC